MPRGHIRSASPRVCTVSEHKVDLFVRSGTTLGYDLDDFTAGLDVSDEFFRDWIHGFLLPVAYAIKPQSEQRFPFHPRGLLHFGHAGRAAGAGGGMGVPAFRKLSTPVPLQRLHSVPHKPFAPFPAQ